jgi:acyl carrier protein
MIEQVRSVFSKVFDIDIEGLSNDQITPDKVYSWDSMNHLNFALSLEDKFNAEFSPEDIAEMYKGLGHVISVISKHLKDTGGEL